MDFKAAEQHIEKMSGFSPDSVKSRSTKALFEYRVGRFPQARALYEQILREDPDHEESRSNLSLIDLAEGRFDPGWKRYNARFQATASWNENTGRLTRPRWQGESLDGKTIMMVSEQGMGDTIQFIRYASAIKQRFDCRIHFCGPPRILALLTGVAGIDQLHASIDPQESYDYWAPLLDLPHLLGHVSENDFPANLPVLTAEPGRVRKWSQRLSTSCELNSRDSNDPPGHASGTASENTTLRIGIAWQGSRLHVGDAFRSFALQQFEPLVQLADKRHANIEFFSLQLGAGSEQIDEVADRWPIHTLGEDFDSGEDAFLDAAAVMTGLDLFIGCDSSLIHLAASLGIPTWVALSRVPDWRWMLDRSDSPWYPKTKNAAGGTAGVTLWRQHELGRWPDVFSDMAENLTDESIDGMIQQRNRRLDFLGSPQTIEATQATEPTQTTRATTGEALPEAVALHQAGKLDEALQQYEAVLARWPSHPDALQLAGLIDSVQGRHDLATRRIGTAVALRPGQATFLSNYAQHLSAMGRDELAVGKREAACRLEPHNVKHLVDLIALLKRLGQHDKAATWQMALANQQTSPEDKAKSFRDAARLATQSGHPGVAAESYRQALKIQPARWQDWLSLGNVHFNEGDDKAAIEAFDQAIKIRPQCANGHANRGVCYWRLLDAVNAESAYQKTLELDPNHANTLINYGIMLRAQNRLVEADEMVNRGYALNPDSESAQVQYAATLRNSGRIDEAMQVLQEANRSRTTLPVLNGIGTLHLVSGDLPQARTWFAKAAAIDSKHASVILNTAILDLLEGDFRYGFPAYEYRREVALMPGITTGTPAWDGTTSLDGQTILLINEQGWGDTFHFVRYAGLLKRKYNCQVHLAVRRPLLALAGLWPNIDRVFPADSVRSNFNCWSYLMSLPLLMKQFQESDFPAEIPYLASDPRRDADWASWLQSIPGRNSAVRNSAVRNSDKKGDACSQGLRIGIAWQGSRANARDGMRSFKLAELAPIAAINGSAINESTAGHVRFISLQSGDGEEQIDDPNLRFQVHRPSDFAPSDYPIDGDGAFIDAASIIQNLDLVISCDSAICHLAAGLGVPTWIALTRTPDWRWMMGRDDSPWYPRRQPDTTSPKSNGTAPTPTSNTPTSNTPTSNTPTSNTPTSNTLTSNTLTSGVTLFRQTTLDDWKPVFQSIAKRLASAVK